MLKIVLARCRSPPMSTKPTIFIDGEAGTTGLQIRDRLRGRNDLELVSIPHDKRKDMAAKRELLNSVDVAILCLPDDAAIEAVNLISSKTRVIDASTAYRVNPDWAYGFAELDAKQHDKIANAKYVSNPGCYPQGLIALTKPLIEVGLLTADYPVTYNAISGYSGGGRKMIEDYEAQGDAASPYMPYGLTFKHKHLAEMMLYTGLTKGVIFQPAVGNYAQGMMGCVPLFTSHSGERIHAVLTEYFAGSRFIEVAPLESHERHANLNPEALNNSNRMRLHVFANHAAGQVLLMAIYDNLGKGASGAAVQNLNLMIGADEATSVDLAV
jgi:N-acetyl-gamma-glutamyl-phosphate reductase